jgi:hypothetical protein
VAATCNTWSSVCATHAVGVRACVDLAAAFERVARLPVEAMTASALNAELRACTVAGEGLIVEALRGELRRHGIDVPFMAHDLLAELEAARYSMTAGAAVEAASPSGPHGATGQVRREQRAVRPFSGLEG